MPVCVFLHSVGGHYYIALEEELFSDDTIQSIVYFLYVNSKYSLKQLSLINIEYIEFLL